MITAVIEQEDEVVLESLTPDSREILLARRRQELERTRRKVAALEVAMRRATDDVKRRALRQQRETLLRKAERLEDGLVQLVYARHLTHPTTLLDLGVEGNDQLA